MKHSLAFQSITGEVSNIEGYFWIILLMVPARNVDSFQVQRWKSF